MSGKWSRCPRSRAALTIFLHREKDCPHPYDCRFYDERTGGCLVRLGCEAPMVETVLD